MHRIENRGSFLLVLAITTLATASMAQDSEANQNSAAENAEALINTAQEASAEETASFDSEAEEAMRVRVAELAAEKEEEEILREWAPLSNAMRDAPADVREFQEHMIILASPWMEGRLPGTRGADLAREYVETQFRVRGLTPRYPAKKKENSPTVSASPLEVTT